MQRSPKEKDANSGQTMSPKEKVTTSVSAAAPSSPPHSRQPSAAASQEPADVDMEAAEAAAEKENSNSPGLFFCLFSPFTCGLLTSFFFFFFFLLPPPPSSSSSSFSRRSPNVINSGCSSRSRTRPGDAKKDPKAQDSQGLKDQPV